MGARLLVRRFAARAPVVVGSPWTFFAGVLLTAGWLATGAVFGWSGTWLIAPSTATSVAAFLLVVLLQHTQNRDTRAIQLKLDELIRSFGDARTELVRLEALPDEELERVEDEFRRLKEGS